MSDKETGTRMSDFTSHVEGLEIYCIHCKKAVIKDVTAQAVEMGQVIKVTYVCEHCGGSGAEEYHFDEGSGAEEYHFDEGYET